MKTKISFLLALFIGVIACTSEDDNTAGGAVTEENSIAQTWVPEVAVDSMEYQSEPTTSDSSRFDLVWYEIKFTTQSKFIYEYYGKNADACVIQLFEKENGLRFTLSSDYSLLKYTQLLNLISNVSISEERFDVFYGYKGLTSKSNDSTQFATHCSGQNAQLEIIKSVEHELHLNCISAVDTLITAHNYLYNNADSLKVYCENMEVNH